MTGIRVPQLDERHGDGRQTADLVGREADVDRTFVPLARTDGRGLPETGEPGVGETVPRDAASKAASAACPWILRAGVIQFEAGVSSGRSTGAPTRWTGAVVSR
jgi:hypothetical protein